MNNTTALVAVDHPATVEKALHLFVHKLQAEVNAHFAKNLSNLTPPTITVDPTGKRYWRVVRNDTSNSRSVHCFVEKTTGDIYKAESWKKVAKHVRGSILSEKLDGVNIYGANYIR